MSDYLLNFMWNTGLTILLVLVGFHSLSLDTRLDEAQLRVAALNDELSKSKRDLASLGERSTLLVSGVDLLSDQCEVTLDLMVNAHRWGWWDKEVLRTLAHLQQLKKERNELYVFRHE